MNKATHALADTGASHSVIAMKWLKYLKLDHLIIHTNECLATAQNIKFLIQGKVIILVEFGSKTFDWEFYVAKELICSMILGINILHGRAVCPRKQIVKIQKQKMPITITLQEMMQHTVIAMQNICIAPNVQENIVVNTIIVRTPDANIIESKKHTYVLNLGEDIINN